MGLEAWKREPTRGKKKSGNRKRDNWSKKNRPKLLRPDGGLGEGKLTKQHKKVVRCRRKIGVATRCAGNTTWKKGGRGQRVTEGTKPQQKTKENPALSPCQGILKGNLQGGTLRRRNPRKQKKK